MFFPMCQIWLLGSVPEINGGQLATISIRDEDAATKTLVFTVSKALQICSTAAIRPGTFQRSMSRWMIAFVSVGTCVRHVSIDLRSASAKIVRSSHRITRNP